MELIINIAFLLSFCICMQHSQKVETLEASNKIYCHVPTQSTVTHFLLFQCLVRPPKGTIFFFFLDQEPTSGRIGTQLVSTPAGMLNHRLCAEFSTTQTRRLVTQNCVLGLISQRGFFVTAFS